MDKTLSISYERYIKLCMKEKQMLEKCLEKYGVKDCDIYKTLFKDCEKFKNQKNTNHMI